MAEYPEEGKFSYKWLEGIIGNDIEPFTASGRTGSDSNLVFGLVIYHLRHLGLIDEDKIDFDTEVPDLATIQNGKDAAAAFWS